MMRHSFTFDGVDMRETYGLIVEGVQDVLTPKLRERKVEIPYRDGAYDFGADWYDEREITITCQAATLTRAQLRELSRLLSRKRRIVRWDEPGLAYVGRIYQPVTIQRIVGAAVRLELAFVCEPFAYGEEKTGAFTGEGAVSYAGTRRTPAKITITNNNAYAMRGITITAYEEV